MNYRKIYEEELGIKLPKGVDVHHLDFNRKNNDVLNLLGLPKNLHSAYHQHVIWGQEGISSDILSLFDPGSGYNDFAMEHINRFHRIVDHCKLYKDYRDVVLIGLNLDTFPHIPKNIYSQDYTDNILSINFNL